MGREKVRKKERNLWSKEARQDSTSMESLSESDKSHQTKTLPVALTPHVRNYGRLSAARKIRRASKREDVLVSLASQLKNSTLAKLIFFNLVLLCLGGDIIANAIGCRRGPLAFVPYGGSEGWSFWDGYTKINAIEICRNDFINYGEDSEAIMRFDLKPNLIGTVLPYWYNAPKHDCKVIDATSGKIWKLEVYVSDQSFGWSTKQRIRTIRVYTDPANPAYSEEYGFMPPGGDWYAYEFPTDQFLVTVSVPYHVNAAGIRIPMAMSVYQSSESLLFNNFSDTKEEIFITIGEPANVYDVSWSTTTEDPNCEIDTTGWYVQFWGLSTMSSGTYGDDPLFDTRFPAGSFDQTNNLWSPAYLNSSDR